MTVVSLPPCLAGGGFMGLMVVWCDRVLHVGTSGLRFGLVYSCWSVGGVAGAFWLPRLLRYTTGVGSSSPRCRSVRF